MAGKGLGLIAGGGSFPFLVARGAAAHGYRVVAAGFKRNTDPALAAEVAAYRELGLGQLGGLIDYFKSQGVDQLLMAGTIDKAGAMDIIPDWRGARALLRLVGKGDDALLRGVIGELESEGFAIRRAHELLPELLTPAGTLCGRPNQELLADVHFGLDVARRIGGLDIGQTVVVRRQVVAAVEALEGTDKAIARGCQLAGPGAVVVKVCKPGQDQRVDLPSVGLGTVETLVAGKAACLAVEAGRSLFFDREAALTVARKAGLCVIGVGDDAGVA